MRRYLVAGNWKLNLGPAAGRELAQGVADLLKGRELKGDVLVCPPFVTIPAVAEVADGNPVLLGAQNCADQATNPRVVPVMNKTSRKRRLWSMPASVVETSCDVTTRWK